MESNFKLKKILSIFVAISMLFLLPSLATAGISLRSQHMFAGQDGLASNRVLFITQDSQGLLWMGTHNGITRYDGTHYYNITRPISSFEPLTYIDNRINQIDEDKNHLLWMKSRSKELCCYDLAQDKFISIPFDNEHPNIYETFIFLSNGDIIAPSGNHGLTRFSLSANRRLVATYYTKENGTLPDNAIRFAIPDNENNVWVGTKHGMAVIPAPGSPLATTRGSFITDTLIYCEAGVMHNDKLWVMGRWGMVDCYDPVNLSKQPVHYVFDDLKPVPQRINESAVVGDTWLVVGENNGYEFDFKNLKLSFSKYFNKPDGRLVFDNQGKPYFFNFTSKLYEVPADLSQEPKLLVTDIYRTTNTVDKEYYRVIRDLQNNLWVATAASGVFCYSNGSETPMHYSPGSENNHDLITSSSISCMYMDHQGGMWIGVNRTGVCYIYPNLLGVTREFVGDEGDWSYVNAICYTGNQGDNILVGNRLGELITYDQNFKEIQRRKFDGNVYDVLYDSKGREWICTRGSAGLIVDGVTYRRGKADTDLKTDNVFSAIEDSKGRIWLCTMGGGVVLVDTSDKPYKFRSFFHTPGHNITMKHLVQNPADGKIWVATGNGLYVFDPDELIADSSKYMNYSLEKGTFIVNETNCLYVEKTGDVWVGTQGGGLVRCYLKGQDLIYEEFNDKRGLINNEVSCIYSDQNSDCLWVACLGGMSRYNFKTATSDNYYFSREPLGNVHDSREVGILADGRFVVGTYYGMTVINPNAYTPSQAPRRPVISGLTVNGRPVWLHDPQNPLLQRSISYANEIALNEQQNNLHFDFFVPGLQHKRRYSYWLEGYDTDWSEASSSPTADYRYLDPGEYVLHVRATNDAGEWTNDGHATLNIIIAPSFWGSTKAYILYALIAILIFGALIFSLRKRLD